MNITENMIKGQILCGVKDLETIKKRVVAGALREKLNTLPLTLLHNKPDTVSFLGKHIALEKKVSRFDEVRYIVEEYPQLSVTDRAIWYELENTARALEPNGNPEDILQIIKTAIAWLNANKADVENTVAEVYEKTLHNMAMEKKLQSFEEGVFNQLVKQIFPKVTPINTEVINAEYSYVFIGKYEDKLHRRYFDSSNFYSIQVNRKQFIQEQTEGPVGENTAKLMQLYGEWINSK